MTSSPGTESTAPVSKASRLTPVIGLAIAAVANLLVWAMDRGPRPDLNGIAGIAFTIAALAFAVVAYRDLTGRRPHG